MTLVALLGTGTMGAGMARTIAAAGHDLRVWNRSPERARALADVATVADDPAEAVRGAEVVVTMLWDADSVESVVREAGAGLAPGTVWLQTSTVGVDGTRRLAALAQEHGLVLVDAPVLALDAVTAMGLEPDDVALLAAAREHLDRAVAQGHGDLDVAATYLAHR
jgi:3-hydroxyisobutyrate dehydrogenase